jgi:hypothetical protein
MAIGVILIATAAVLIFSPASAASNLNVSLDNPTTLNFSLSSNTLNYPQLVLATTNNFTSTVNISVAANAPWNLKARIQTPTPFSHQLSTGLVSHGSFVELTTSQQVIFSSPPLLINEPLKFSQPITINDPAGAYFSNVEYEAALT